MKVNFLFITTVSILIMSCTSNSEKDESTAEKDKNPFKDTICNCTHLVLDEKYNHFFHEDNDRTHPFSGTCRDSFPNTTQLRLEKQVNDGKNHGNYKLYHENGVLKSEKTFINNYVQEIKHYFPSGVLKYHATYKAGELEDMIYNVSVDSTLQVP